LPTPDKVCSAGAIAAGKNDSACRSGLIDWGVDPIIEIEGEEYFANEEDTAALIEFVSETEVIMSMLIETKLGKIDQLINPGVPMAIVWGNHIVVPKTFIYNYNPLVITTETQNFYFPDGLVNSTGDGTVLANSALVPFIKWRYEFMNNIGSAKPIKFFEYCSVYNTSTNFYDSSNDNMNTFNNSNYNGLNCICTTELPDPTECEHSCIINDKNFVGLMINAMLTN